MSGYLAAAGSAFAFQLDRLYAGADADSDESAAAVAGFIEREARDGVGAIVGGYMSDRTLLEVKDLASAKGVTLLASSSGLSGKHLIFRGFIFPRVWPIRCRV